MFYLTSIAAHIPEPFQYYGQIFLGKICLYFPVAKTIGLKSVKLYMNLKSQKVQLGVVDKHNVGRLNTSHLTTMAGDLLQKLICYYCAFFKNECSSDSDTSFDKFSLKTVDISQKPRCLPTYFQYNQSNM